MTKPNTTQTDKAEAKAHTAINKAAEVAETVEMKARETTEAARVKAEEAIESAKTAGAQAQTTVTDYVNDNPLKAVGIAFGAGLIASALLRK